MLLRGGGVVHESGMSPSTPNKNFWMKTWLYLHNSQPTLIILISVMLIIWLFVLMNKPELIIGLVYDHFLLALFAVYPMHAETGNYRQSAIQCGHTIIILFCTCSCAYAPLYAMLPPKNPPVYNNLHDDHSFQDELCSLLWYRQLVMWLIGFRNWPQYTQFSILYW